MKKQRKANRKGKGKWEYSIIGQKRIWMPDSGIRPRPVTAQERAWLIHGLQTLSTGNYFGQHSIDLDTWQKPPPRPPLDPQPYLAQIDKLVVTTKCRCGQPICHTITFRQAKPAPLATLVFTKAPDGRILVISVNRETRELADLELI